MLDELGETLSLLGTEDRAERFLDLRKELRLDVYRNCPCDLRIFSQEKMHSDVSDGLFDGAERGPALGAFPLSLELSVVDSVEPISKLALVFFQRKLEDRFRLFVDFVRYLSSSRKRNLKLLGFLFNVQMILEVEGLCHLFGDFDLNLGFLFLPHLKGA